MVGRLRRSGEFAFGAAIALLGARALAACDADDNSLAPSADAAADGPSADGAHAAVADGGLPAAHAEAAAPEASTVDATATGPGVDQSPPVASFDPALDFGAVGCGGSVTRAFTVRNVGAQPLAVSATTTGSAFSVSPSTLSVAAGASEAFAITASVAAASAPGASLVGALNLFTNDRSHGNVAVALGASPTGGALTLDLGSTASASFGTTPVGVAATPLVLTYVNTGNAPEVVTLGSSPDPHFSLTASPPSGATLAPGDRFRVTAGFTATDTRPVLAKAAVSAGGGVCGASPTPIALAGAGATGSVQGWPSSLDFGGAECGAAAGKRQSFTLTNVGQADAHVTSVAFTPAAGFTTSLAAGQAIAAGGSLLVGVVASPLPSGVGSTAPITSTLSIATDSDATPHGIQLQVMPIGAILAFDTSATRAFGSFGSVVLLKALSQTFGVTNTGSAAATVTLAVRDGTDAAAPSNAFQVPSSAFTVAPSSGEESAVVFSPTRANLQTGSLSLTASGPVCSALPSPLPLSGNGIAAGVTVAPASLAFAATCGGGAPSSQQFTVVNDGTLNLTWALGAPAGPGAAQYQVQATPGPGVLSPGASATVVVTAKAVFSPAPAPDPASLAATLTLTTDVPFDAPHVVSLNETPLGDQLAFSVGALRFGQFPVGETTLPQTVHVVNHANAGSPPAHATLALLPSGASPYALDPSPIPDLAPGDDRAVSVTFSPAAASSYPASLELGTSDPLCSPLPPGVVLGGTGTLGQVNVSATTLAFGSDPSDASGLVDCGGSGQPNTVTISNGGNQPFTLTGVSLAKGAASPFALSGSAAAVATVVAIGQSVTLTLTPRPIPQTVPDPTDPTPFSDTLTLTTDVPGDAPHDVSLVMQPRGAVIDDTPLTRTWAFATVSPGTLATFTTAIRNRGNGAASASFTGLAQPSIFGLASSPTAVLPGAVTAIVGQFNPPSAFGAWSDQGTLTVTADAFCAPLPAAWAGTVVQVTGTSGGPSRRQADAGSTP